MKRKIALAIIFIGLATCLFMASALIATANSVTTTLYVPCTNYNLETSPRCYSPIDWFAGDRENGFYGELTSGVTFRQGPILTDRYIFLHKMIVEDAFWYVDHKGTFQAPNDLVALSLYLTR